MRKFSVTDTTRIIGISKATVRNYARDYSAHLSGGANPSFGATRQFTLEDLRVFAYVRRRTSSGLGKDDVLNSLPAGLNDFEWELPQSEQTLADVENQLVPNSTLQIWESQMQKKDSKIDELTDENKKLIQENGELKGENKILKRSWWQKLRGNYDD